MTRAEFLALPSKERYERGDRVVTWDRASRPALPGIVYQDPFEDWWGITGVEVDRNGRGGYSVLLPRSRVRLAPVAGEP